MKFTVTVLIDGKKTKITWKDGQVSCKDNPRIATQLHMLAVAYEGRAIDCIDPLLKLPTPKKSHLKNPFSVYWLIERFIGKIIKLSGDPMYKWYHSDPNVFY